MSATSAPPAASALASSATATLPPANRSPMMPDPTIVARRRAVPSAGTEKTVVNPLAIRVMAERGVDIGAHTSKLFAGLMHEPWDYLITVCDDANERCPFAPGTHERLHWSFEDPSRASGSEENR